LPRIFDRFVRADDTRTRPDGSGLGLAIVGAIINAHQGEVTVSSSPGSTTFTIRLPIEPS
jgi:signal transduction histidine kinase